METFIIGFIAGAVVVMLLTRNEEIDWHGFYSHPLVDPDRTVPVKTMTGRDRIRRPGTEVWVDSINRVYILQEDMTWKVKDSI